MKPIQALICTTIAALISASSVQAAPYASGVTNSSGTISYYLNSTPTAGAVTVTTYPSATHPALTPSAPAQGVNSFPLGGDTSYAISVSQTGNGVPSAETFASANTPNLNWGSSPSPRGLAVNVDPTNGPVFGTIYAANASAGGGVPLGLFAFHSDYSPAFGLSKSTSAYPTFWGGANAAPFGLTVSPYDGSVLVVDASSGNANVFQCDPYLRSSVAPLQLLAGLGVTAGPPVHGGFFGKAVVKGSLANGNLVLYTFDNTMPSVATNSTGGSAGAIGVGSSYFNSTLEAPPGAMADGVHYWITAINSTNCLYRYTIGGAGNVPWANPPELAVTTGFYFSTIYGNIDVAPDGKLFLVSFRAGPGSSPLLTVYDPSGQTNLFCSATSAADDVLNDNLAGLSSPPANHEPYSVKVSPDNKYVAIGGYYGYVSIYALTNGVPDISTYSYISFIPTTHTDYEVAWDAADNIYLFDSNAGNFGVYDIGQTETCVTSNDSSGLHGSFTITTPPVTANVAATTPQAYQANNSYVNNGPTPVPAVFTITLSTAESHSVSVYFVLGGTSTNTVNYTATTSAGTLPLAASNVVVFPATVTNETVTITPTANPASGPPLYVTLMVLGSSSSGAGTSPSGAAYIANSGPQVLTVGMTATPSMYRGVSNDFAAFYVLRYGDTNVTAYLIPTNAYTYGGTATLGVDYLMGVTTPVYVNPGDVAEIMTVSDPVATGMYHGNESIIVGLNTNAPVPFLPATTTMTLVDNADPSAPVLWSDPLTNAAASANWTLTFANTNLGATQQPPVIYNSYPNYTAINPDPNVIDDFDVEFGYSITNDNVGASPAMLLNGWTNALKMTVNKNASYISTGGCSAGVNVYPTGKKFSGNYALRFSMNLCEGNASGTTEYDIFGINHYGTNCNWFAEDVQGGTSNPPYNASYETNQDGIWYWLDADTTGILTYGYAQVYGPPLPNNTFNVAQHLQANVAPFTNYFKNPIPYSVNVAGTPVNYTTQPANSWCDVEVKQVNNVVTLSMNKFPIMSYVNATNAASGDIMLGYDDPYSNVGSSTAAVYYSNVRVIQLTPPSIVTATMSGTTMTITFTDSDTDDTSSSFELLSASKVTGAFTPVQAVFTQLPSGAWQAVVTVSGPTEFFDVVRL